MHPRHARSLLARASRTDAGVPNVTDSPTIVILGGGMSGICMGIMLKRAGIESFVIVERSPAVGGTWWDNVYPGAQCDVRSHLYCFSFEPKADWSRLFAPSQEIQAYLEHCVDRYNLRRHLRQIGRAHV